MFKRKPKEVLIVLDPSELTELQRVTEAMTKALHEAEQSLKVRNEETVRLTKKFNEAVVELKKTQKRPR